MTKICKICKQRKTISDFAIHRVMKDGISNKCKKCENSRQKEARETARDWKYPYSGLNDPNYIKDKTEFFNYMNDRRRKNLFNELGIK